MEITVQVPEMGKATFGAVLPPDVVREIEVSEDWLSLVSEAASPVRYRILRALYLAGGTATYKDIVQSENLTGGSLNMQFQRLVYRGLISKTGRGVYTLTLRGTIAFALVSAAFVLARGEGSAKQD